MPNNTYTRVMTLSAMIAGGFGIIQAYYELPQAAERPGPGAVNHSATVAPASTETIDLQSSGPVSLRLNTTAAPTLNGTIDLEKPVVSYAT
jgi:hypothetical protein